MHSMLGSLRDLAPIILVIGFFQLFVLQQPLENVFSLVTGVFFVILGLTFFIYGLEMGLFPIGESMAHAFARKGSAFWLLSFAFALGFGDYGGGACTDCGCRRGIKGGGSSRPDRKYY